MTASAKNCIDIVTPFTTLVERESDIDIQLIGGIGSAALAHPDTEIDFEGERIVAPANLFLPQHRDDGNLRDIDVLVLSNKSHDIEAIEAAAQLTVGDQLEISVFGLKEAASLRKQLFHPGAATAKVFLSDRYGYFKDGLFLGFKSLFPFVTDLPAETLDTWRLEVGDQNYPIPHPGTSIVNYLTRSISGLRPKDADKVGRMASTVFEKAPDIRDWIIEGPGKSQLGLADALHSLREPLKDPQTLSVAGITLKPTDYRWLLDHPTFAHVADRSLATQESLLQAARAKSRALHIVESNAKVVTLWQRFAESKAGMITHNK